jgi:ketosteroid isomerase-like protein
MSEPDIIRTALRFVNEINRHDVTAMMAFLSEDHLLVDGSGHELRGRERLREAWSAYFEWFPDYRILIEDHMQVGIVVGLFGFASGTLAIEGELSPDRRWRIPAAWKAVVRNERVEKWQVFADNEPVRKLMGPRRGEFAGPAFGADRNVATRT